MNGPDWSMRTFHIDGDNSSYFDKTIETKVEQARAEIIQQVRNEANQVIHNIVTGKDAEIEDLKKKVSELEHTVNKLELTPEQTEPLPTGTVSDLTDFDIINNAFTQAIKHGKRTEDNLNNEKLETLRETVLSWKEFFEEYKWKSNYISNKIQTLLKETNNKL